MRLPNSCGLIGCWSRKFRLDRGGSTHWKESSVTYVIEKNIPIPPHGNAGSVYRTLLDMVPGDSVFFEGKRRSNVGDSATRAAKATKGEYVTRSVEGGVRIWRVS